MTPGFDWEVSVPVIVKVRDGKVISVKIDIGYPGFFSDAEDGAGVWDDAEGQWGCDDQEEISQVAWQHIKARLGAPFTQ